MQETKDTGTEENDITKNNVSKKVGATKETKRILTPPSPPTR